MKKITLNELKKIIREEISSTRFGGYRDEQQFFSKEQAKYGEFGLRAFPGLKFRISVRSSYFRDAHGGLDNEPVYYVEVWKNNEWLDFAKSDINELKREIVPLRSRDI